MKTRNANVWLLTLALAVCLPWSEQPVGAQRGEGRAPQPKSDRRILYHNGRVMTSTQNLYLIWYGCWTCGFPGSNPETTNLLTDFAIAFGGSPYAQINTTYPDASGYAPTGGLIYGGSINDLYSQGPELTEARVEAVLSAAFQNQQLPVDPRGIYILLLSSDVSIPGLSDGRCQYHGSGVVPSYPMVYGVIANPMRAPSICAPQFENRPSPNDNVASDAMASWMGHVMNGAISNPWGNGWYDRYGLENSDKCVGYYGETYATPNGGVANMLMYGRHMLIQQNWVNIGKGYCGLSL